MIKNNINRFALLFLLMCLCSVNFTAKAQKNKTYSNPVIQQSLPDPTIIKADDGYFYLYATEDIHNVPIYKSKDLVQWNYIGTAFNDSTRPRFVKRGGIWAPDINKIGKKYVMYHAMSTWGGEWEAGVGIATADKPEGPFTSLGKMFISKEIKIKNCIDPFYIEDNGKKYLFWGSFHGIYGARLSKDGLSLKKHSTPKQIAGTAFEGTYIYKRNGYYYLIASTGTCCEGAKSTYTTVYGRSKNLFGPYCTKDGKPMMENHYEVLIHGNNSFVGTGHNAEIVQDDNASDWIIYHAFSLKDPEAGRLVLMDQVHWKDDWPYVENNTPSSTAEAPFFK
jgi:arabinan endo-1,5-alpha-L-arabinosidase